jgi:nucleoside phosphorylase
MTVPLHPDRVEIARYLLSRGLDPIDLVPSAQEMVPMMAAMAAATSPPKFPSGMAPTAAPLSPEPGPTRQLPKADVVVVTWTVDELAGLARVFTPGMSPAQWYPYARDFSSYRPHIRPRAPAAASKRLGSYMLSTVGDTTVLCVKSELHLNQDGVKTGDGTATLPVKDFFQQLIREAQPSLVLTVGTAGSVFDEFRLGDVVVTRAAKFRLGDEFRNEAFNHQTFVSDWALPTGKLKTATRLMRDFASELTEPPFGPPTSQFGFSGPLLTTPASKPAIRLELGGRDMPEFHPILTTDFFEYGTTANRLDREGAAVEMGDAVLGLACSELADPPHWAVVRNMSDPVINGDLPAREFHLNTQTTWAVGYYTAYGKWTSIIGALATWGIIAGL